MKTSKITLENIKYSDGWMDLVYDLFQENIQKEFPDEDIAHDKLHEKANLIFEYGEYANLEIKVDENLNIIGGKIFPFKPEEYEKTRNT
jgi:hypothetical protein